MTVYADILFFVNASMDLLTLIFAARITHRKVKRRSLLLGAGLGGLLGTAIPLIGADGMTGTLLNLAVMTAMAIVTFGVGRRIYRDLLIVCGSGTLLGGIMTALLSLGEPVMIDYGSSYPSVFLGCAAAAWGFTRLFSSASMKKAVEVSFTAAGEIRRFTALCDSGSFLTEPMTGTPVITVSREILGTLAERLTDGVLRIRVIPVKTLTGEGMLWGFVPDRVSVDGTEVRAVIAMDEGKRDGFDGIVPAGLSIIHKE